MTVELQPIIVKARVVSITNKIHATVSALSQTVKANLETAIVTTGTPPYVGDYIVIPQTNEQILPTNGLRMTDDVTVRSVPYYEVSNQSGLTVYIAQNIND